MNKVLKVNISYAVNLRSRWAHIFKYMGYILYYKFYNLIIILNASFYFL